MFFQADVVMAEDDGQQIVRLSKLEIAPEKLEQYKVALKEEIEASIRLEPGVLTLYAVFEKRAPNKLTILEIYKNRKAYESHIKTPHFLKYKTGTLDMVINLELIDTDPLIPDLKIK
jgi:4-carboxymuconolactone decarboxylase